MGPTPVIFGITSGAAGPGTGAGGAGGAGAAFTVTVIWSKIASVRTFFK